MLVCILITEGKMSSVLVSSVVVIVSHQSLSLTLSFTLSPFRTPEQCPSVVSLLSESYNPHVRCGAAMALGICCAGTGNKVRMASFYKVTK